MPAATEGNEQAGVAFAVRIILLRRFLENNILGGVGWKWMRVGNSKCKIRNAKLEIRNAKQRLSPYSDVIFSRFSLHEARAETVLGKPES
jgi:hypothetical protein